MISPKINEGFTFAITGVTGLLGRNLMFEIIKQNFDNLQNLTIIVFGRSSKDKSFASRVSDILQNELCDYLGIEKLNFASELSYIINNCLKFVEYNLDLGSQKIDDEEITSILFNRPIDVFFHVASLTDFRDGNSVEADLVKVNIMGTKKILDLVSKMKLRKFSYVSSAYVCGISSGKIMPDHINLNANFRNPYERTKLEAELMVRNFAKINHIKLNIFRPSTICGRLIESRLGATPKFDVFYGWGIFFLKYKLKVLGEVDGNLEMDLRFTASNESGLNIVPVDFVAKAMYAVSLSNSNEESYHLVNKVETPHKFYFFEMLNSIGVKNVQMINKMPANRNKVEDFYYKTVGKIFDPYINCPSMDFDSSNLDEICSQQSISCPEITKENFALLMDYAKEKKFGLSS